MKVEEKQAQAEARGHWLKSAQDLIDYLDTKPGLIDHYIESGARISLSSWIYGSGKDEEARFVDAKRKTAKLARLIGNSKKTWGETYLEVKRKFGPHDIQINVNRESICVRKVVGTEFVPEHRYAAHTRELVEWECSDPSILRVVPAPQDTEAVPA